MGLHTDQTVRDENDLGELAWIVSVILADGTLTRNGFRIQIAEKDEKMAKIIQQIFWKVFNKNLKIIKRNNSNVLQIKSKEVFNKVNKGTKASATMKLA